MTALLILEGATRIFYEPVPKAIDLFRLAETGYYERHDELGWLPKRSIEGVDRRFSSTFRTNSRGLRDKEYTLEKPVNRLRTVVLGDSHTWGVGVSDDEIYTEIMERSLSDMDVINLGVSAFGLRQEILYLEREGLQYDPDIVLLGFCLNDIYRHPVRSLTEEASGRIEGSNDTTLSLAKEFFSDRSYLYGFIVDRANTNKKLVELLVAAGLKESLAGFDALDTNLMPALKTYPPPLNASISETEKDLIYLKERTANLGIRLVIAVVPSLQTVREQAFKHTIAYSEFEEADFDLNRPYVWIESFAREHGIEVITPVEVFRRYERDGTSLYLDRDSHMNKEGHELFASVIVRYLLNTLSPSIGNEFKE